MDKEQQFSILHGPGILTLNAGSSSLRLANYTLESVPRCTAGAHLSPAPVDGPDITQAACFDSGFYADLPPIARTYALLRELREQHGIRRYGFHGLAHQSMLNRWRERSHTDGDCRVISLQLGAGCSVTATDHGWPIETSMGFSPFALWFSLLHRESLSQLNVFTFLTPIFGLVMGVVFFAEQVRVVEMTGIGLSLLGIYWVSRSA